MTHTQSVFLTALSMLCLTILWSLSSAYAETAINCHCFQQRQFTPDHPEAFDPYLLATVQNRYMASYFNVSRKDIVKLKMSGTENTHLWVAYEVAKTVRQPVTEVLSTFQEHRSWAKVLKELDVDPEGLGSLFFAKMLEDRDESFLAWTVVRQCLSTTLSINPKQLDSQYASEKSFQEIILASVLASRSESTLPEVFSQMNQQGSWGRLLANQGLSLQQLEKSFLK